MFFKHSDKEASIKDPAFISVLPFTVEPRYFEFGYLEQPPISNSNPFPLKRFFIYYPPPPPPPPPPPRQFGNFELFFVSLEGLKWRGLTVIPFSASRSRHFIGMALVHVRLQNQIVFHQKLRKVICHSKTLIVAKIQPIPSYLSALVCQEELSCLFELGIRH